MNRPLVVLLAGVMSCQVTSKVPEAETWTVANFVNPAERADELLVRWTRGSLHQPQPDGTERLTIFPAYADGRPAAFVITELWANHPKPWLLPVYLHTVAPFDPVMKTNPPFPGSLSIFPVDFAGSFYSPYWRATYYQADRQLTDAVQVVGLGSEHIQVGSLIYCPLVPGNVVIGNADGGAPTHPFTDRPLQGGALTDALAPGADGGAFLPSVPVHYLAFGLDRVPWDGDTVYDTPMYVFTDGTAALPLPAILPDDPIHHGLARVVDVVWPPTAYVFVPPGRKAAFKEANPLAVERMGGPSHVLTNEEVSEAVANTYFLRVLLTPNCVLQDAGFPDSCTWVDSASKVEAQLPTWRLIPTGGLATFGLLTEAR
jgi:hypothetical protein